MVAAATISYDVSSNSSSEEVSTGAEPGFDYRGGEKITTME
jgi:hypothetical protein